MRAWGVLPALILLSCADGSAPLSSPVTGGEPQPPAVTKPATTAASSNTRGAAQTPMAGEQTVADGKNQLARGVKSPGHAFNGNGPAGLAGLGDSMGGAGAAAPARPELPRPVASPAPPPPAKPKPRSRRRYKTPKKKKKPMRRPPPADKAMLKLGTAPAGATVHIDGRDDDADGDMVISGKVSKSASKVIQLDELMVEGMDETEEEADDDEKSGDDSGKRNRGKGGKSDKSGSYKQGWDFGEDQGLLLSDQDGEEGRDQRPDSFLPRMCYFENTYLGGNAAHTEHLRRLDADFGAGARPYRDAKLPPQLFDPPTDGGLALTASLDRRWIDKPGRVVLQVGLQGSQRYGWRRPPIDVALVVDQPVVANDETVLVEAVTGLIRRLGPQDRMSVVLVGPSPVVLAPLGPVRDVRKHLAKALDAMRTPAATGPDGLARAMGHAGDLLEKGAGNTARVPGAQTVLLLTQGGGGREQAAQQAAHDNNLRGLTNSVIDVSKEVDNDWWSVANAGYGNYHQADPQDVLKAVDAELESLSRVIGRLLRLNVRLAPNVEAIRVIGSRVLGQQEVKAVKAREETTDRQLSKTMGVKADRGEDDDGIQTVIPYFYGGDSHVVLIELWVNKPGPVADVTLKFKDMVTLANATARANATLSALPRAETPAERAVKQNLKGFEFAQTLQDAGRFATQGRYADAHRVLQTRPPSTATDRALANNFRALLDKQPSTRLGAALTLAGARRVGHPP